MPVYNSGRTGAVPRKDVPAHLWGVELGTDFWFMPYNNGYLTTGNAHELADYNWTTTSLVYSSTVTSDFMSAADAFGNQFLTTDGANDLLLSPVLFGDYLSAQAAASFLGYQPTTLTLEMYGGFSVHSANETVSGFGFSTGSGLTATNQRAFITSNSTNFLLRNNGGSDAGLAVDAVPHLFKIVITAGGSIEWFADGTSQGTLALEADVWPTCFCMSAGTTNRSYMGWAHIYYR